MRLHLYLALFATALLGTTMGASAAENATPFHVLVFSKTLGYRHDSITNGVAAIRELGAHHGFTVDNTEDSAVFTPANLARFQTVVFLSVTGEVLDPQQKSAFRNYVTSGGGFVAIHGAMFGPLACEDKWSWYGEMFCCTFTNHSAIVPATVVIEDTKHPSTAGLPLHWKRSDEWYNYTGTPRGCAHIVATVDESTYTGGKVGVDHPIAWCRQIGQGRMWYTAMGHTAESFSDPNFCQHLLGGILITAGRASGDFTPNTKPSSN